MPLPARVFSRDAAHLRADLAASLAFALGPDASTEDQKTADTIVASVHSFDDSQQCLIDVRDQLGVTAFGHVTLFHLHNQTSLMGQSEVFTSRRELATQGLTLRDLAWPASELKAMFADDAVDTPGLVERLEEASAAYRAGVTA